MTEDEAKTKWCPFARVPTLHSELRNIREIDNGCSIAEINKIAVAVNRNEIGEGKSGALCIASACMGWRWDEPWTSQTEEGAGGDIVIRLKRKAGEPMLGFCGLSGGVR